MNIELSIYKIKNYAYFYGLLLVGAIAGLLSKIYNYTPAEYITISVILFLFIVAPVWWEVRKLETHFKNN